MHCIEEAAEKWKQQAATCGVVAISAARPKMSSQRRRQTTNNDRTRRSRSQEE
jgi:hypothetical protein